MYECKFNANKNQEVKARCLGENLISVYLRQETHLTIERLIINLTRH